MWRQYALFGYVLGRIVGSPDALTNDQPMTHAAASQCLPLNLVASRSIRGGAYICLSIVCSICDTLSERLAMYVPYSTDSYLPPVEKYSNPQCLHAQNSPSYLLTKRVGERAAVNDKLSTRRSCGAGIMMSNHLLGPTLIPD